MKHRTPSFWRALVPAALTLALTGCGGSPDLSQDDVDRIAQRTAELMKKEAPTSSVDPEALQKIVQKVVRTELARADRSTPAKPPVIPPPVTSGNAGSQPAAKPTIPPPATPEAPKGKVTLTDHTNAPQQDPVLARVGDEDIRRSDFERMIGQNQRLAQAPPAEILNNLVHFRIMARAAEAAGYPGKDPKVAAQVKDRLDSFRMELLIRDQVEGMPEVDESLIKQAYQDNLDTFTKPARVQLHEIVVGTEAEAKELLGKAGAENFSKLAGEHSILPTARRGGNLGEVTKERFPKERWDELVEAAEGSVLGPFETEAHQWQLLLRGPLQEREVQALAAVREAIEQRIVEERRAAAARKLLDEAGKIWPAKLLQPDPSTVEDPDEVLYQVGSSNFTKKDFQAALAQVPPQQTFAVRSPEGKQKLLSQLFQRELLSNLAKTNAAFLDKHSAYLKDVERQLIINAFAAERVYEKVEVSDDDARRRYAAERAERFRTPAARSIRARHILIRAEEGADEATVKAAEDKIQSALARVKAGEDFGAVARDVSEGPTKPKGGDLGQFGPGRMVKPFDEVVQALKPWEVTNEPVRTRFGFHIIRRDPTPEFLTFTEVRAGLINQMKAERQNEDIQGLIASLKSKTTVETFPENLPGAAKQPDAPATPTLNVGKGGKVTAGGKDAKSLRFEVRDGKIVPVQE